MQEGYQNFNNSNNFDPNSLARLTSSVIMFVVIADISPSIESYEDVMNSAFTDVFMKELKNCHRKDDIVMKCITFNEVVEHKSGFLPIVNLQDDYLTIKGSGGGTALFQAVLEGLESAERYRTDLEDQGVDVRTCIWIETDGADNASSTGTTTKIKKKIDALRQNEAWAGSFTINMLGVGEETRFRNSCIQMGLDPDKCLDTVGTSAKEIRKHMGVVSQSVSSSAAKAQVNF